MFSETTHRGYDINWQTRIISEFIAVLEKSGSPMVPSAPPMPPWSLHQQPAIRQCGRAKHTCRVRILWQSNMEKSEKNDEHPFETSIRPYIWWIFGSSEKKRRKSAEHLHWWWIFPSVCVQAPAKAPWLGHHRGMPQFVFCVRCVRWIFMKARTSPCY